MIVDNCVG